MVDQTRSDVASLGKTPSVDDLCEKSGSLHAGLQSQPGFQADDNQIQKSNGRLFPVFI